MNLLETEKKPATSFYKWLKIVIFNNKDCNKIFELPKESKVIWLQLHILHRMIPTNNFFSQD